MTDTRGQGPEGGRERSQRLHFRLVHVLPDGSEETRPADAAPIAIGRSRDCDIRIDEVRVSRRHCVVYYRAGALYLQDQGSSNGTFVNDMRVTQARLNHGDVIGVGSGRIRVEAFGLGEPETLTLPTQRSVSSVPAAAPPVVDDIGTKPPRQLSILTRLSALLASPEDQAAAAEAALDLLLEAMPVDRAWVLVPGSRASGGGFGVLASRTRGGGEAPGQGPGATIVDRVLSVGRPFHSLDVAGDPALSNTSSLRQWQVGAVMCAPLTYRARVVGALYADARAGAEGLSQETLSLFEAIAAHAGVAVGRAADFAALVTATDELRRQRDDFEALAQSLERKLRRRAGELEERELELAVRRSELDLVREARSSMAEGLLADVRELEATVEEGLASPTGGQPSERAVAAALSAARRLVGLFEDARDAVTIEEGGYALGNEPLRAAEVLGLAARRAEGPAKSFGVTVTVGVVPSGQWLLADPRTLTRLLDVLIDKSLRLARGGTLELGARPTGSAVELLITERGRGAAAAAREELLGRWGSSAAHPAREVGVTLYYCRLAAEAHGGRLGLFGDAAGIQWVLALPARREGDADTTVS